MAKMIHFPPHVKQPTAQSSPVYAVVAIPLVRPASRQRKRSFSQTLTWFLDVAVSAGLGAMMLIFLLLLIISL